MTWNKGPGQKIAMTMVLALLFIIPQLHALPKTGAETLLLGGSARATALRGAFTAAAGDVDAMVFNPGGLSAIGRNQISVTHAEMALNANYDTIQYAQPQSHGAWGVSMARLDIGEIEGRSENRVKTGTQQSSDVLASLSYSCDFRARAGVGATVKFFESQIANEKASTLAFDLGTVVRIPSRALWLGFSALNLGHGLKYLEQTTPLPFTLAVGVATQIKGTLNVLFDVKRNVRNDKTEVVTGFEYFLLPTAQVRLGYAAPLSESSKRSHSDGLNLGQWKGGLGLGAAGYQLDYSISSDSEVEPIHRVSLSRVF